MGHEEHEKLGGSPFKKWLAGSIVFKQFAQEIPFRWKAFHRVSGIIPII
jgi:hypothetical protein